MIWWCITRYIAECWHAGLLYGTLQNVDLDVYYTLHDRMLILAEKKLAWCNLLVDYLAVYYTLHLQNVDMGSIVRYIAECWLDLTVYYTLQRRMLTWWKKVVLVSVSFNNLFLYKRFFMQLSSPLQKYVWVSVCVMVCVRMCVPFFPIYFKWF